MRQAQANVVYKSSNDTRRVLDLDTLAESYAEPKSVTQGLKNVQRYTRPATQKVGHLLTRNASLNGDIPGPTSAGSDRISELIFESCSHALQHTLKR